MPRFGQRRRKQRAKEAPPIPTFFDLLDENKADPPQVAEKSSPPQGEGHTPALGFDALARNGAAFVHPM